MVISDWTGLRRVDDRWPEDFMLLDRRAERAAIDRVLDAVRSGLSGPSTVDYHLRKLNVTSRTQPAGRLRPGPRP